jgi:catechol 2,3-dioxygenase-like lactoylglutathione lyase family enzyme
MKRLHVHVGVADLDQSIRFYSTLFASEPTVVKADYAKWMLDDPRVNFAISAGKHDQKGIKHLGIQAESADELGEIYGRLKAADRPVLEEGRTTCCYAKSEKSWVADPDGVVWEAFYTDGEATVYGDSPELAAVSENASESAFCVPAMPEQAPVAACCR